MTKIVKVGNVPIGGGSKISVQTMTNVKTFDSIALINQIEKLTDAGADIIRVTVNDEKAVDGFAKAVKVSRVPLVADIHYDYSLAIKSIEVGASKIRINPGNMSDSGLKRVCEVLRYFHTPVRVGVNSGSLPKDIYEKYGNTPFALVESALRNVRLLEKENIDDIVISVKSSDTSTMIKAYRDLSRKTDYPLHLGVTEAGGGEMAVIKSSIGIGSLLSDGIGDTIRVSLSDDPIREVEVAKSILNCLNIDKNFVDVISCPTCGRTDFDVISCANRLRSEFAKVKVPLKIAVMGCVVNGLGEGKDADFGIAGGKERSIIFSHGNKIAVVDNDKVEKFLSELVYKSING